MNASTPAIETAGLVKAFGDKRALDGIDLQVGAGQVYGFLGPNGAGKTTAIRILATLLQPDAGFARVLGFDVARQPGEVRRRISITGQFSSLDGDLTGLENLLLLGRLLGFSRQAARGRADQLLEAFDLQEARNRLVRDYSGGMLRRLDLASSIIVRPELLFLDEPTTGLDPRSRNQVWEVVRALAATGTTVLLTTQYLDEADQLADRIAVIDQGRLIAEGTPAQLKSSAGSGVLHVRLRSAAQAAEARRLLHDSSGSIPEDAALDSTLRLRVARQESAISTLQRLSDAGIEIEDFALGQASLDEVFLALTGHSTQEDDFHEHEDIHKN